MWKLPPGTESPDLGHAPFVSITRTAAEVSVVAPADRTPEGVRAETGWACLEIQGPLAFELTGILATVSAPLAAAAVPIFAVSTYNTDYVLVRTADLERAVSTLEKAGHNVAR